MPLLSRWSLLEQSGESGRASRGQRDGAERRSREAVYSRLLARSLETRNFCWRSGGLAVCAYVCVSRCSLLPYARVRARRCTYTEHGHAVSRVYDHSATVREEKVGACVPATFVHRGYMPRNFTTGLYRDTHTHTHTRWNLIGRAAFLRTRRFPPP